MVSHDIPDSKALHLRDVIKLYDHFDQGLFLAINIKADGLQELLLDILEEYQVKNYFVFDMSVPDAIGYFPLGVTVFTRESDISKTK